MNYIKSLKRGSSCCFGGQLTEENLPLYKSAGIEAVEISFPNVEAMQQNEAIVNGLYKDYGIELWSIHLPFSRKLDISILDDDARNFIIETNLALIEEASKYGVKVAVLHPSSEPITDEDRPERLRRSKEAIIALRKQCDRFGMTLAVENLPRTCLCNRSAEMIELLKDTGASIVFDTNHALAEDNLTVLSTLIDSGLPIHSLHISDYDFVDERHRLPGDGVNPWQDILALLERAGYTGPLLYEVSRKPKERDELTVEELYRNMVALASGEIR